MKILQETAKEKQEKCARNERKLRAGACIYRIKNISLETTMLASN